MLTPATLTVPATGDAPRVDGPFLRVGGSRFVVRGITYGTFARTHPDLLPDPGTIAADFAAIAAAGFTTVRTYTVPRPEVLDLAAEHGLRMLVGVWWQDPLYAGPPTRAAWSAMAGRAVGAVRAAAAACVDHPAVLALLVGNEIPAGAVRWYGPRRVERLLRDLHGAAKDADPTRLTAYANYPTTGHLDTSCFDLDCMNVFLEQPEAFRRYLAQLQASQSPRPLVLTELGMDARSHGETHQAQAVDWQLRTAYEAGVAGSCLFSWTDDWWVAGQPVNGWGFGLTRADRTPKPALQAASTRHRAGLLGVRPSWPRVSVVLCAYQAESTLDACLESLGRLAYPDYEVLVVDDGSTDATAAIASRHPVRLLDQGRRGLSAARNLGLAQASGEVVAYLDADAFADPDWLAYLVTALHRPGAAAAGGPNLAPTGDPQLTRAIAQAPGGPVHVLIDDEDAEHVPGCNMGYWRQPLRAIGGFDPVYRTAGDDADVCWKLLDLGHRIAFHPAALVWHHPRSRIRDFWRQQVGYGRAEALLAQRHPDRFADSGHARWRGTVYGPVAVLRARSRLYAGRLGEAPHQRLYPGRPVPTLMVETALLVLAVFSLAWPPLALPLAMAVAAASAVLVRHGWRAARRGGLRPSLGWGLVIGALHAVQPIAREVGRRRGPPAPDQATGHPAGGPALVGLRSRRCGRGLLLLEGADPDRRGELLRGLTRRLTEAGLPAMPGSAWSATDLTCRSRPCWRVRVTTHAVEGAVYLRYVRRPQPALPVAVAAVGVGALSWPLPVAATVGAGLCAFAGWDALSLSHRLHRGLPDREVSR